MTASIDVHLIVNGTKTLVRSDFQVYRLDEIPRVAHDWIKSIRMETGYFGNQSIIEKVIVDGDKDITDLVKGIDNAPIPDDNLPF
jgi:hypothetical protein